MGIIQPNGVTYRAGDVTATLRFNINFANYSNEQIRKGQRICDSEVMRYNDKYIRFQTGSLRRSFQLSTVLGSGEYKSNSPYAVRDYHNTNTTPSVRRMPLTGGMHFERMKADHKSDIEMAMIRGMNW